MSRPREPSGAARAARQAAPTGYVRRAEPDCVSLVRPTSRAGLAVPLGKRHLQQRLRSLAPGTVGPLLVLPHQVRFHGILADVGDDPVILLIRTRPMIKPLILPEPFACET